MSKQTNSRPDPTLNRSDLKAVEKKLSQKIDGVEKRLDRKIDGVNMRIDTSSASLKDELMGRMKEMESNLMTVMDDFIVEIRDSRDERLAVSHKSFEHGERLDDHNRRIEKVEAKVFGS